MSHVSGDPSVLAQRTFKGKITRTVMRNSTRRNSQRYSWPSGGKCWRLNDRRWCLKLHSGLFIPIYNGHIGDGLSLGWLHSISWHGKKNCYDPRPQRNDQIIFGAVTCQEAGKWRPEMSNLRTGRLGCGRWPTRKNHRDFTGNASEDLWWIAQRIMPHVPTTYFIHLYTISVATLLVD